MIPKPMLKKILYLILVLAGSLLIAYWLQPMKRGEGQDAATRYELEKDWLQLPPELRLGNPAGLGIDTGGNIIIFHRAGREWPLLGSFPKEPIKNHTVLVIDRESGRLLGSWGGGVFIMPHGLTVDRDNNIWVTDIGLHQVMKFSHDGKLLMRIGEAAVPGNDSLHFDKPTDVAIAADGSFYVTDGYGNNRVVKFSAAGRYLFEWGKSGSGEGAFNLPHGISIDKENHVFVADRENHRIQEFDASGSFMGQWSDDSFGAMCSVFVSEHSKVFAIDDFTFLKVKHRGSDVLVFDSLGTVQTRFGRSGGYAGATAWYHDLAVDDDENIYVGDILKNTVQKFRKHGKSK